MENKSGTDFKKLKKTYMVMVILLAAVLIFCGVIFAFQGLSGRNGDEKTLPVFEFGTTVETFEALYTYEDMEEDLYIFKSRYPEIFKLSYGDESHDGRKIYCVFFGEEKSEKTIMINAGIHGREYLTPLLVMKQLEYYLEHFDTPAEDGKTYREHFKGFKFCIVPMINPDGIAISQFGAAGLQSGELRAFVEEICSSQSVNAAEWKANAKGVDLNRNFGISDWNMLPAEKLRDKPSSELYKGASPNSEPETKALINITESIDKLIAAVSYHSQGEVIYWKTGKNGNVLSSAELSGTERLMKAAQELTGYKPYNEFNFADGTYNDWCVLNKGIPSINIETGKGVCPLPISQFETIWKQNKFMWLKIAEEFAD